MRVFLLLAVLSLFAAACRQTSDDKVTDYKLTTLISPADTVSGEPYLYTSDQGDVYLSWVETSHDSALLKYSRLDQGQWSIPKTIAKGTDWFVNWADYPMISASSEQHLLAHFLKKSGTGTYSYDIKIAHSADNGASWSAPVTLHDDGKQAEHGFVSMLPHQGQYFIFWLDGRNMVSTDTTEQHGHSEGHGSGAMTLRAAIVDTTGTKVKEWQLDNRVCDCCQTTAALTKNGPVVIYRDRSDDEIRDMSIIRWADSTWTSPQVVYADNWKIAGCPVNGPRVASINNTLAVGWFSAPEGQGQVKLAFSYDGGNSFHEPIRVGGNEVIGRVDVVLLNEDQAVVSWMEGSSIKAVKVDKSGSQSAPIEVATSSEARSSGFPQMTKKGNDVIFAWTDHKEKTIKTAIWSDL
ncbi:hypothetical protein GCM10009122_43150 [Fulvivirga kasyanovii]|uniref:Exo-alpha-sialidase n=1 Tax=Fulvivirga kasyanovii TaxID=396812 RepID=A0ABW9RY58_9BACT|nr:sialidase family protein [Fulvivirga kasyanovii]MTI28617.1 exo-alpha-sialidase [Fulvivirga kasyanovii]